MRMVIPWPKVGHVLLGGFFRCYIQCYDLLHLCFLFFCKYGQCVTIISVQMQRNCSTGKCGRLRHECYILVKINADLLHTILVFATWHARNVAKLFLLHIVIFLQMHREILQKNIAHKRILHSKHFLQIFGVVT
jgi:hypothetical protein